MLSCAFWLRLLEVWCSACERLFIVFTPARETALPSCLGSDLHMGERREEGEQGVFLLTQHKSDTKCFHLKRVTVSNSQ